MEAVQDIPPEVEKNLKKSILKPAFRTVSNTSRDPAKKRVEITTPNHSSNTSIKQSNRQQQQHNFLTPLPRVAFLPHFSQKAPAPAPVSDKPKQKTIQRPQSKHTISPTPLAVQVQRSNPAKISVSAPKIQSKKTTSHANLPTTMSTVLPNRAKRSKKKKKKSKSMSDVTALSPLKMEDAGKEYVKELATINDLLKSVTEHLANVAPTTAVAIPGFFRPFSADELQQLLASVDKVATIHQKATKEKTDASSVQENSEIESEAAKAKLKKKSKKIKKSKSKASSVTRSASTGTRRSRNEKIEEEAKSIPAKGAANKNLASKKTLKSNVKSLKKSKSDKGRKSGDITSELSELDLVKSAMLNRRYYRESMAEMEDVSLGDDQKKKSSSQKIASKKRAGSKDSKRQQVVRISPLTIATHGSASSLHSRPKKEKEKSGLGVSYIESFNSEKNADKTAPIPPLPLPPLTETDRNEAYHKALGNVLINYSHVIRPPVKRSIEKIGSQHEIVNRSVALSKQKLDSIDNKEELGLEDRLQKLKQRGLINRGVLEIDPKLLPDLLQTVLKTASNKLVKELKEKQESVTILSKSDVQSKGSDKTSHDEKPRSRPVEGLRVPSHKAGQHKAVSNANRKQIPDILQIPKIAEPQIVNLASHHPSKWTDPQRSVTPSLFQGYPNESNSTRWSLLNLKVQERNRQLNNAKKAATAPQHHQVLKEDLDHINRIGASEERKEFLQNLDKAKKAFDTFGVHDPALKKNIWKAGQSTFPYEVDTNKTLKK